MRSGANERGDEGKDSEERERQYEGRGRRRGEDSEQGRRSEREGLRPRQRVGGAAGLSAINSSTL